MASTLHKSDTQTSGTPDIEEPIAVIDADELDAARRDPRVRAFLMKADAYLGELERQGRSL